MRENTKRGLEVFGRAALGGACAAVLLVAISGLFLDYDLRAKRKDLEQNAIIQQYNSLRYEKDSRVTDRFLYAWGGITTVGTAIGLYRLRRREESEET